MSFKKTTQPPATPLRKALAQFKAGPAIVPKHVKVQKLPGYTGVDTRYAVTEPVRFGFAELGVGRYFP